MSFIVRADEWLMEKVFKPWSYRYELRTGRTNYHLASVAFTALSFLSILRAGIAYRIDSTDAFGLWLYGLVAAFAGWSVFISLFLDRTALKHPDLRGTLPGAIDSPPRRYWFLVFVLVLTIPTLGVALTPFDEVGWNGIDVVLGLLWQVSMTIACYLMSVPAPPPDWKDEKAPADAPLAEA